MIVDCLTPQITLSRSVHKVMSESTPLVRRLTGSTSATSPSSVTASVPSDQNQTKKQESEHESTFDNLMSMFVGDLSPKEVIAVYHLADDDCDSALDCLLSGPILQCLLKLHKMTFYVKNFPQSSMWILMIFGLILGHYELVHMFEATDTGGVCLQVFSDVFELFADNKHAKLFEGPPNFFRPVCSAES